MTDMAITINGITLSEPIETTIDVDTDDFIESGAYVAAPPLPLPCDECGWQYPTEALEAAGRGEVTLDPHPTHLCRKPSIDSDPVAAKVFGPVAKWGHLPAPKPVTERAADCTCDGWHTDSIDPSVSDERALVLIDMETCPAERRALIRALNR